MTQTTDAALVERLRALLDRRRSAGEAYDRLLAEVEAQSIDEDDDDDRGLRRSHSAVMVASSLLSHASVEAVPVLLDTIEAQARRIEALEELCDAACSNAETALRFLAEAGRPNLAEIQSIYIVNIRAALDPTP